MVEFFFLKPCRSREKSRSQLKLAMVGLDVSEENQGLTTLHYQIVCFFQDIQLLVIMFLLLLLVMM